MAVKTAATETALPVLEIDSINFNFSINYRDVTDPENQQSGHFTENVNLNFSNEKELNQVLTSKDYLQKVIPTLAKQLVKGITADTTVAKELKATVQASLGAK